MHDCELSPSFQEMKEAMGLRSNSSIQNRLKHLHDKGYIHWVNEGGGRRSRTRIRILKLVHDNFDNSESEKNQQQHQTVQSLQILGVIAAGGLVETPSDESEFLELSGRFPQPQHYALKVTGESMIGENILSGDIVIMRKVKEEDQVRNGVIVAAMVEGEGTTLKRFYRQGDQITLKPANSEYPDIETTADQLKLQGIVVGVWRELGR